MKIIITKKKIGKGEKSFETLETTIFNTPVRIAKALSEELKNSKEGVSKVVNGASAEFTISEEIASRLYLTATVKNGYTNLYLTLKKGEAPAADEDALPF